MENRTKRFYKVGEVVWIVAEKKEAKIISIDLVKFEVVVELKGPDLLERGTDKVLKTSLIAKTLKLWEIDKLKFKAKDELIKGLKKKGSNPKVTYLATVEGGIIPTKDEENAGRDCYARLDPIIREGKMIFELHIPKLTLAKIPLGFASYLCKDDVLSLKHERSSIGSTGLINVSGLIDSTYLGEVSLQVVPLVSDIVISSEIEEKYFDEAINTYFIPYGKAIAQAVIFKLTDAEDVHIPYEDLLSKPSKRGTGGWGSTGK